MRKPRRAGMPVDPTVAGSPVHSVSDRSAVDEAVEAALDRLASLSLAALRAEWPRRRRDPIPPCRSPRFLRLLLAWSIQEAAYGGHPPETLRKLREHGRALAKGAKPTRRLSPGTVLTRDWHGTMHRVVVLEKGFAYGGAIYPHLSAIARAITRAHWSGPRFFGLKDDG